MEVKYIHILLFVGWKTWLVTHLRWLTVLLGLLLLTLMVWHGILLNRVLVQLRGGKLGFFSLLEELLIQVHVGDRLLLWHTRRFLSKILSLHKLTLWFIAPQFSIWACLWYSTFPVGFFHSSCCHHNWLDLGSYKTLISMWSKNLIPKVLSWVNYIILFMLIPIHIELFTLRQYLLSLPWSQSSW